MTSFANLHQALGKLEKEGNFDRTLDKVQEAIDLLTKAKSELTAGTNSLTHCKSYHLSGTGTLNKAVALAKLKQAKSVTDEFEKSLKDVYHANNSYGKVLNKVFIDTPALKMVYLTLGQKLGGKVAKSSDTGSLAQNAHLINRAIAMHLLREGQFGVAETFMREANTHPSVNDTTPTPQNAALGRAFKSEHLQSEFQEMYTVLHELRENRNLEPAIEWARRNSSLLDSRGSNLLFELCRLKFIQLFVSGTASPFSPHNPLDGPLMALQYAQTCFKDFQPRYAAEISQLMGAFPYYQNLPDSPYRTLFDNASSWNDAANSFTKEFCSLLGLSPESPLFVAATAGCIALPLLAKAQEIMRINRTDWTTAEEMPVPIPLPPAFIFHSIFVCPVSKEQATDRNPPMMMPCAHVICKESLEAHSKGSKFKCPYCPSESHPSQAVRVYL